MSGPEQHRQLLVHTLVANPAGRVSERYIDQQIFDLWLSLVQTRHGLTLKEQRLCVWLPEGESERQADLAARQPFRAKVQRLVFECYDPQTTITSFKARFVPAKDAQWLAQQLYNQLGNPGYTTLQISRGEALATYARAA